MKSRASRVLIIDDDPLIRTLLVSSLRKECFVAVAAEGAEGFAKALELKPDVAVIDVNMPGWDGLKTLEAFRSHIDLRDIKIIMLTADASKQTVMAAVRAGANDYLIKTSFSKADFYRKLNRLVPDTICQSPLLNEPRSAEIVNLELGHDSANVSSADADESLNGPHNPDALGSHCSDAATSSASHNDASADSQLQVMIDGWE